MDGIKGFVTLLAVVSFLSLGLAADSHAKGLQGQAGLTSYETFDLTGTQVTNSKGEGLGRISDFVIGRDGRIILAILYREGNIANQDGRYIAVPFHALSISEPKPHDMKIVLDVDEQKLEMAPHFNIAKGLTNRKEEAGIYRYFGQRPYWTEQKAAK